MNHSRQHRSAIAAGPAGGPHPALPAASRPAAPVMAAGTRIRTVAAAMTTVTAIRETLTIPGQHDDHHDQARAAREFTRAALSDRHPCTAVAVLLVSELVTNSMLHSDSRRPGGTITITVTGTPRSTRVEVRDAGGTSVPALKGTDDTLAESGRGLRLVRDLAARWAYRREPDGLVTWFEIGGDTPA